MLILVPISIKKNSQFDIYSAAATIISGIMLYLANL